MGAGVGVAIAVGSAIGGIVSASEAAQQREEALQLRQVQERAATDRRAIQRDRQLERVISAQNAAAGARGFTPSSGSFQAIQQESFNQFAEDTDMDGLNLSFKESALETERQNVRDQFFIGAANSLFDVATEFRNSRVPKATADFTQGLTFDNEGQVVGGFEV